MRMFSTVLSLLMAMGIVLFQMGCGGESQSKTKNDAESSIGVPVEVARVKTGDISAYFSGTATLEAKEETDVVAKVGGVVKQILAEEGDEVQSGKVLAKLDDEKLAVQLQQARANLQKLENEYQRSHELFKKNLISTEEFQRAQYEYEHQKASYDLANLDLQYTSIRSPINGVIAQRLIKRGNMILTNQAVFRVTGLNPLQAVLYVPEHQMGKMQVGQTAHLRVDAVPDNVCTGRIERISPVVDPSTGTMKVTIEIDNAEHRLKPGMFTRIDVVYDVRANTLLVPKNAIMAEDRESCVFVVKDSVALRRLVETGYVNTSHTEILKGLEKDDVVVTTGKSSLKDSIKVDVVVHSSNAAHE
jgi:membrane fusion protein (multidrug efflux system)